MSDAVIVLSTPNATNELHSIAVTCTIHPDSTANQCTVMAMTDGRMTRTGNETIIIAHICILVVYICDRILENQVK